MKIETMILLMVILSLLVILPVAYARKPGYFGTTHDFIWAPEEKVIPAVDALVEAGVEVVRMSFRWQTIEYIKGQYQWERLDWVVSLLEEAGVEILAILDGTPYWAADIPEDGDYKGWLSAYPPLDLQYWRDFVRESGERYKGRIKYWQICNEQNIIEFARPKPDPEGYTERLKIAYEILKSIDPDNVVVLSGMSVNGVVNNMWSEYTEIDYLQKLYDAGAGPYFDVLALHPYTASSRAVDAVALTEQAREAAVRNGDQDKPVWITEIGTPSGNQVSLLKEVYQEFPKLDYVEKVFWFSLLDNPDGEYGLLTLDFEKKLCFYYYKQAASGT